VIASSVRGFEGGPALAADGRVVIGELAGNGALRFLAIDPATRAVTRLITTAPLADALTYNEVSVSGTGAGVTATVKRWREATGPQSGPEQDIAVSRNSRTMTLLPTVSTLFECSRREAFSNPTRWAATASSRASASSAGRRAPQSRSATPAAR
jgi:hypothetical protein